jgi:uncharacterized protein
MRFTWDSRKARANLRKHGISFEEATTVFLDPFADAPDLLDSERTVVIGKSASSRILFVVTIVWEDGETVRSYRRGGHPRRSGGSMKRAKKKLPEGNVDRYDWSKSSRGRFAKKAALKTNLRRLDADLEDAFPDSESVNRALRALLALASVVEGATKEPRA